MTRQVTLIANPGSESRKYALYDGTDCIARLHFETVQGKVVCQLWKPSDQQTITTDLASLQQATEELQTIIHAYVLGDADTIGHVVLRVVAPSTYFLADHIVDDTFVSELERTAMRAPIHIGATLDELKRIRVVFSDTPIIAVSDSAFHRTKPVYASYYGLPFADAERFDLKRFGYHGLSVASAVDTLKDQEQLVSKLVVCHLGGGASISAVKDGISIDNSMGYSPLEGLIMATRCGSIDPTAVTEIQRELQLDDDGIANYLNKQSGLLGISGTTSDIRDLLVREADGDQQAAVALQTYVYTIQKTIGQMVAALGGVDAIAFTGTVGERSATMRERILEAFDFADIRLSKVDNANCTNPQAVVDLGTGSKQVFVIPTNESEQMLKAAHVLLGR